MRRILLCAAMALVSACQNEELPPPPVSTSDGGTENPPDETGDSSSTGEPEPPACEVEYAEYGCRGFAGCVYRSPSGNTFKYFHVPTDGGTNQTVQCVEFDDDANGDFGVCAPYVADMNFTNPSGDQLAMLNEQIMDVCEDQCEDTYAAVWATMPATIVNNGLTWTKDHCECQFEFQPDGRGDEGKSNLQNPYIPVGLCDYIFNSGDPTPDGPQVEYQGACEDSDLDDECPAATCSGWSPAKWTAAGTTGGQRWATVDDDQWERLFGSDLIECDAGRLVQHDSAAGGPAEWWDFQGLVSGDFLYEIGLRTGDIAKRVRIGANWFPITTDLERMNAFEQLNGATTFRLEVQRGVNLVTIDITIADCGLNPC
jgi:hypothetical protein